MGHIHAAAMAEYSKDAAETDKPWERWEISFQNREYTPLEGHPLWYVCTKYRRKPRTLTYAVTMPEPLMEAPKDGEVYYVAAPHAECFCIEYEWSGSATASRFLKRGMCFATKEDAIAAAKAMLPIKQEEV